MPVRVNLRAVILVYRDVAHLTASMPSDCAIAEGAVSWCSV
jgi:hypothetical protein